MVALKSRDRIVNKQKGNSALFRGHGFFSRMRQYAVRRNEASGVKDVESH